MIFTKGSIELTKKNSPNIQFKNHDIRSYVKEAILQTQLLNVENRTLEDETNISSIVQNLEQILLLTEKVSLSLNSEKTKEIQLDTDINNDNDLDRIFNVTAHMVCIASSEGYFLKISPAFIETLGFSEQELFAKPFVDFVHPDEIQATLDKMETLSRGLPTIRFQNRYICKDGSYKWLEWTARCFVSGGDIYATAYEVTERKRAEEELSELIILQKSIGVQFLLDHSSLYSNISFITKITNIVLTNMTNSSFDVNALAENVFMSRSTLQRKIKLETGVSAAQFIRKARLAKAHDLIKNNVHNTLTETAYAVGFKHTGYFSRLYKEYVTKLNSSGA